MEVRTKLDCDKAYVNENAQVRTKLWQDWSQWEKTKVRPSTVLIICFIFVHFHHVTIFKKNIQYIESIWLLNATFNNN